MARVYRGSPHPATGRERWGIDTADPATGKRTRRLVGTKEQAQRALAKLLHEASEVQWFGASAGARNMTVAEMADLHVARLHGRTSQPDAAYLWRTSIVPWFGADTLVSRITPAQIIRFKNTLIDTITERGGPMKPASVNRRIGTLSTGLQIAMEEGAISKVPMPKRVRMAEKNQRDRVLSDAEVGRLAAAASPDMRMAIIIGADMGLRRSEIVRLRKSDVSFEKDTARVQFSKTDRGRAHGRVVPLTPRARWMIERWPHDMLCRLRLNSVSRIFGELVKDLGIEHARFHDLRHTCATRLAEDGTDVFALMRAMGWSNIQTASRYIHTKIA